MKTFSRFVVWCVTAPIAFFVIWVVNGFKAACNSVFWGEE